MDSCLCEGCEHDVKHKQLQPGFELLLMIPFSSMLTITLNAYDCMETNDYNNLSSYSSMHCPAIFSWSNI